MDSTKYLVFSHLATRYKSIITNNSHKLQDVPPRCSYDNLLTLCDEIILNGNLYPSDKLSRWIGFVQGVLSTVGIICVDKGRNLTRPVLHMLHQFKPPSFG